VIIKDFLMPLQASVGFVWFCNGFQLRCWVHLTSIISSWMHSHFPIQLSERGGNSFSFTQWLSVKSQLVQAFWASGTSPQLEYQSFPQILALWTLGTSQKAMFWCLLRMVGAGGMHERFWCSICLIQLNQL
jgi:hypothetical protein